jgi:hypothetical protein
MPARRISPGSTDDDKTEQQMAASLSDIQKADIARREVEQLTREFET